LPQRNVVFLSVFLLIICWSRSAAQVDTSSFILSPRIGNELDSTEREYFGLLPRISHFVSARTSKTSDGNVTITIARQQAGAADTTIRLTPQSAEELSKYVNEY